MCAEQPPPSWVLQRSAAQSEPTIPSKREPQPPFSVKNCLRYGAQAACEQPLRRVEYPQQLTIYLYHAARATFEQQARHKLRLRRPAAETEQWLVLGDLTQRFDSFRTRRTASTKGDWERIEVSLGGVWTSKDDLSLRLLAAAWLSLWNAELRDPFPEQCAVVFDARERGWKQKEPGCVDVAWMVRLVVVNAKYRMAFRPVDMENDAGAFWHNTKQRWSWAA